jgi:hypothetical protein
MSSLFKRARIVLLDRSELTGTYAGFYGDICVGIRSDDGRLLWIPISSILLIEELGDE